MRESLLLVVLLCASGCARLPESFPPPAQRRNLEVPGPGGLLHFVALSDPGSGAYIVRDILRDGDPSGWRWGLRHPELRFYLPTDRGLSLRVDLITPGQILKKIGALTVAFKINGKLLAQERYDQPGEHQFLHPVPAGMLVAEAVNTVSLEPDKVWVADSDGQPLSVLLGRAGFVE